MLRENMALPFILRSEGLGAVREIERTEERSGMLCLHVFATRESDC